MAAAANAAQERRNVSHGEGVYAGEEAKEKMTKRLCGGREICPEKTPQHIVNEE